MHRAWRHHDARAERDFLVGLCLHVVGLAWVVLAGAILLGTTAEDGSVAAAQIQEVVVFTNAAARIVVLIVGGHVMFGLWCERRRTTG
jgi:hypothetical protein